MKNFLIIISCILFINTSIFSQIVPSTNIVCVGNSATFSYTGSVPAGSTYAWGFTVTLSAGSYDPNLTYTWTPSASNAGGSLTDDNINNVTATGSYVVTVSNSNGCNALSLPYTVTRLLEDEHKGDKVLNLYF